MTDPRVDTTFRWWQAHLGRPYWRPGNPGTRFGNWGWDCSGGTFCAYQTVGINPGYTTSDIARRARARGMVFSVAQAQPGDLLVHSSNGDPYNSDGPVGHVGEFTGWAGGMPMTYESAGSRSGVGHYHRSAGFWLIACRIVTVSTMPAPPPKPPQEEDVAFVRLMKGDQRDVTYLVRDLMDKRGTGPDPNEIKAIRDSGVLQGHNDIIIWPQSLLDKIPEVD